MYNLLFEMPRALPEHLAGMTVEELS